MCSVHVCMQYAICKPGCLLMHGRLEPRCGILGSPVGWFGNALKVCSLECSSGVGGFWCGLLMSRESVLLLLCIAHFFLRN